MSQPQDIPIRVYFVETIKEIPLFANFSTENPLSDSGVVTLRYASNRVATQTWCYFRPKVLISYPGENFRAGLC